MAFLAPKGILVLSIDLEVDARHSSARDQRLLERLTSRLFDLLVKHRVPATWSVADPAVSAATDRLMTGVGHEIAVLGDPAWVGADAGRPRFARELERRVQGGREIGLPVTTLALRKVHLDAHLDVVVKNGLNAVRGPETTVRNRNEFNQPQSLYSGLWLMWPSCVLPGPSRWLWGTGQIWRAQRGLALAAERREVFHLMIEGRELADRGAIALRGIERVARQAAQLRDQGSLEILTVASAAGRLNDLRQTTSKRVNLAPAA